MATPNLPPNLPPNLHPNFGRKLSNVVPPPASTAASLVPAASAAASQVPVAVVNASVNANPVAAAAAVPAAVVAPNANAAAASAASQVPVAVVASASPVATAASTSAGINVNHVNVSVLDTAAPAAAAAAQVKNDVSNMDTNKKIEYLLNNGETIANNAFTLVQEDFLKNAILIDVPKLTDAQIGKIQQSTNKEKAKKEIKQDFVRNELANLKTIFDVQNYEKELKKKLEEAEQAVINAPEKSNDPTDAPKLKGAMIQNIDARKKYNDKLIPVLHVLESKIKASNTLSTIEPLKSEYETLIKKNGDNNPIVKRQEVVLNTAFRQYAQEIKHVLKEERNLLDVVYEKKHMFDRNPSIQKIAIDPKTGNEKVVETIITGALSILPDNAKLKADLANIQLIIKALVEKSSTVPLLDSNGITPLANWSKKPTGPIRVTVPIKNKDGRIDYVSYKMDNGVFTKLDRPIEDNKAVEDTFKEAVNSAKEGTKVVKMTYKNEPLIVSMNISHPNKSYEKANMNLQNALKKEAQTFAPEITTNNGITIPGIREMIDIPSSLSMNELESARQKILNNIAFVNTNTKVLPENKKTLKNAIRESLMPINTAIQLKKRRKLLQEGGKTAKKSKKNNKTKKSTRRSS